MPQLHGSGDIFRAVAGAGFDEGIVRGKVGSQARLTFDGDFVLCHGLTAEVNARASAAVDAGLTALFLLSGQAHGEAFASAGAGVDARLSVDLFDSFGFSASVGAFAEATVAGRLSVALDLQALAGLAQMQLNNVAFDIFMAFLNEVSLGVGIWGQLSAAAMAKAHVNVHGSLKSDSDAGFVVEVGAAAGCGAGAGYDFYVGMKFDNPKRFYLYAVERITREIVSGARAIAPPAVKPAIPLLELALPTVLNASYELAQKSVINSLSAREDMASSFVKTFAAQLQRFLMDKMAECSAELLRKWLDDTLHNPSGRIVPKSLDSDEQAALDATLDSALDDLRAGALDWETFERALPKILDCLTALFPDQANEWRVPVTALWSALTAVHAIRTGVGAEFGQASISLAGGIGEGGESIVLPLPDPPAAVREELEAFFGGSPARFTVADATAYLAGTGISGALSTALPDLQTGLTLLESHTGITIGDIISGGLQGAFARDVVHTEMYRKLRAFFAEALDGYVLNDLLPALRRDLGPGHDARIWIDEVAEPSLQMASSFIFDRLDEFVNGSISGSDLSPAVNSFRTALSHLVGKIVTRNVVVVSDIVLAHAIESLEQGFLDLESTIRRDSDGVVSRAAAQVATVLLPPFTPVPSNMAEASQELFADLANAGAAALGPRVFSPQRRERMRDLMIQLLDSIDGDVDYTDGADVDNFFKQLFECTYVPDPDGLFALLELQVAVLKDEFDVLFPRVTLALEIFYLSLTKSVVDDMFDGAVFIVRTIADALQKAWEEFRKWQEEYEKWEQEVVKFAREMANHLEEAADILRSSTRRSEIITKLKNDGIAAAEDIARRVPGFDLLSEADQEKAIGAAVWAFTQVFNVAKPLLNDALRALGDIADNLGDLVDDAANLPDLRNKLGDKIRSEIVSAVEEVTGLNLPDEIGPSDIGDAAAYVIRGIEDLRDALGAIFDARIQRDEAEQERLAAQSSRDRAGANHNAERAREDAQIGEPVRITVVAPLPPTGPHPPVYPGAVQLIILIKGARLSYVDSATKRVLVALNGQPVTAGSSEWSYSSDTKTLSLSTMLTAQRHGLRAGLNVIECSVTDGTNEIARATAPFAANMALPFVGDVQFDYDLSVIDVRGDDHDFTSQEYVTLNNLSMQPTSLRSWWIQDAIGHRYVFGNITLPSGGRLTLHTGPGDDETASSQLMLFWGRNRAIWNNTGDTALLVDPTGITRATLIYIPERRRS